jgi:hypothetical protein
MGRYWLETAIGLLLFSPLSLRAQSAPGSPRSIYVSPTGNDAWTGSLSEANGTKSDGPLRSLARARDVVRAMKTSGIADRGPIHVYLCEGVYYLAEPLVLTPADSGTPESPVVWSAYENEHPVISGGRPLGEWSHSAAAGGNIWQVKLSANDPPTIRQLWLDGRRLGRCRWPKHGTLAVAARTDAAGKGDWMQGATEFRFRDGDIKAWPTATDGEAIVTTRWVESHLPIASIDAAGHIIRFHKKSAFQIDPDDRYWIENIRDLLSEPGEFYVDSRERTISLIAPAGTDPNKLSIVAPRLANVLILSGDPAGGKFVEHIVFQGLSFSHTQWSFDPQPAGSQTRSRGTPGPWDPQADPSQSGFSQAAIGVPGAIWASGARNCRFDHCQFAQVGTYGIELARGCQNNRITHSVLTDLGAGGIKIGETQVRNSDGDTTAGNEVSDCTIADGGNLFPSCVALWIGQSPRNFISHNDIHGFWYTGISIGWTWGYGPASAQRNVIEYNHVHHLGMKADGVTPILSDMGAIYTLGNQDGSIIRGNRFHDIAAVKYGGWGIYFDEGTTHLTAENNLVYRTTHGGFHQHYGRENVVRNNIFAFGRDAQIQRSRVEDHESIRFERNIVLWDHGNLLAGDWHKLNVSFDHNTYWHDPAGEFKFADWTWDQWRQLGMDQHSKIADPKFVDPVKDDFQLRAESADSLAGFDPFDLSDVGPRKRP